jgi:hypothetical protein
VILAALLTCFSIPATAQTTVIRVNAGGPAYTDSAGQVWSADTGYNSGTTYSTGPAIAGTTDDALYKTGRYDSASTAPTLQYSFTVPNGGYEVRLYFADGAGVGKRKLNVQMEGVTVLPRPTSTTPSRNGSQKQTTSAQLTSFTTKPATSLANTAPAMH